MELITFLAAAFGGFVFNRSLSKEGYQIKKRLPFIKLTIFQLSPNIKIHFKNRTIHIHHWLTYTVILIITLTLNAGILDTLVSRGYLIGGIAQGLTFSDWRKVIVKRVL